MLKFNSVVFFSILFVFLISSLKSIYIFNFKFASDVNTLRRNCVVLSKNSVSEDKITYLVKYDSNNFLLNIKKDEDILYDEFINQNEFNYGDVLSFRANIYIPQKLNNPYEFDYKMYLNSNNIVAIFSTDKVEKIGEKKDNIFLYIGSILKNFINKKVDENLQGNEASLYKSMLYGEDIYLSSDVKNYFSNNGLLHILATSGMHMFYIIMILNYLLKNVNEKLSFIIKIIVIVFFCIISNLSLSILRAGIMSIISSIDITLNNRTSSYKKLIISFIILICFNPYYIFNSSFILSYLSTLGIITLSNLIYTFLKVKTIIISEKLEKILSPVYSILSVSLSSFLFIFPMQIYFFGYVNIFSFFTNVVITPIIMLEFLLGFLSIIFSFVPLISNITITSNYIVLKLIIAVLKLLSNLNYFTIYIPRFSNLEISLYYVCLVIFNVKKYIPLYIQRKYRKKVRDTIFIVTFISYLYIISMYIYRVYFEEYVYYFNVEQGNMALIRENRKIIIVDIGSTTNNLAYNVIKNFLNAKAIYNIDIVFLTHMHEDHVNGIYKLAQDFNIKNIAMSEPPIQNVEYEKINNLAYEKNIGILKLKYQDNIKYQDINIDILNAKENEIIKSDDIENSNSMVILISIKDKNYLFMGDATTQTEEWILKNISKENLEKLNKLTAIQIGHHGSKTSSSEEFIKSINSCIAIISAKKEKYGHPSKETIDILNKYKFNIKITQKDGAIKL